MDILLRLAKYGPDYVATRRGGASSEGVEIAEDSSFS
jgi:hypothetical protein